MVSNRENLKIISIDVEALNSLESIEDHAIKVYEAAKIYIHAGLWLVPVERGSKSIPGKYTQVNYNTVSKNLSTIEKWFNPHSGKFKGWNIGLATGKNGGVFALDIDRHAEVDGTIALEKYISEHGEINAPMQTTPNNGCHYLFQWELGARNSSSALGAGIDTKGGKTEASSGHINTYPSIVDGRQYKWQVGGVVPLIPEWIMAKLVGNRPVDVGEGSGRGNENVGDDDIEDQVPVEQIGRMLKCIDPDSLSYEDWLRIGQAINSQHPNSKGLGIWDKWSEGGERYQVNECRARWRGFNPAGSVRVGTLFYHAKVGGWEREEGDTAKQSKLSETIQRLNQEFAVVVIGGKIRILREKRTSQILTDNKYDLIGVQDFATLLANDKVWLGEKPVPVAQLWIASEERREYPNGLVLDPEGTMSEGAYNTWAGYNVEPAQGQCDRFLKHIKEIVCGDDDAIYEWVLDWCADLFQDPANPKGCCIVLRGAEGAGKGTFANTIGEYFGPHFRHLIDDSHLLSNFNAHMIDAIFVFADEITWGGNKKTAGKLKGMVTERYLVGERKGIDAVGYRNMTHMMIASNNEWVIPAGANSRRWLVLDVVDHKTRDPEYFDDIYFEMNNGGKEAFLWLMLQREITSNLGRAPDTEALGDQRVMSMGNDTVLGWWIKILETGEFPIPDVHQQPDDKQFWPEKVIKSELHEHYEAWCMNRNSKPLMLVVFCSKLKAFGFSINTRVKIHGKNLRCARVPNYKTALFNARKYFNVRIDDDEES